MCERPFAPNMAALDPSSPSEPGTFEKRSLPADKEDMDLSGIALQGLEQAEVRFVRASSQLSSMGAVSADGTRDTVDLSQAAVALVLAKDDFAANLEMVKVADQMERATVDLLA